MITIVCQHCGDCCSSERSTRVERWHAQHREVCPPREEVLPGRIPGDRCSAYFYALSAREAEG